MVKPDITVTNVQGSFDSTNGALSLFGNAIVLTGPDQSMEDIYYGINSSSINPFSRGRFELNAVVDANGNISSGTFSVKGVTVSSSSSLMSQMLSVMTTTNATLLEGTLKEMNLSFPTSGSTQKFNTEIRAEGNGGTRFSEFGSFVMINLSSASTADSFLTSFQLSGGTMDVARAVPEPGSGMLWAAGAFVVLLRRRRSA